MSKISQFFIIATLALVTDITICEAADCSAGVTAADKVVGHDGHIHTMTASDKYLANTYVGAANDDQCKFKIVLKTQNDPNVNGGKRIKWMSLSFGVHNNDPAKYEREFQVSKVQGKVIVKGRALSATEVTDGCFETDQFPEEWRFCLIADNSGCWTIRFAVIGSPCGGSVTYCEPGMGSNDSDNDQVTMSIASYYNGLLQGMCGDQNGDSTNDPDCTIADPVTCAL